MLWHCAGDGGKKARSPGRLRRKPLKPSRRECRTRFGDLWWTYSYAFICMRGCGCGEASGIPCSLCFRGTMTGKARAKFAARRRRCGCLKFGSVGFANAALDHLAPRAGRGRPAKRSEVGRVRGSPLNVDLYPPHPNPLPAGGARELNSHVARSWRSTPTIAGPPEMAKRPASLVISALWG